MFAKIKIHRYLSLVPCRLMAVFIWCLCLTLSVLAAPGDLDLTFDSDGKVILPIGISTNDLAFAVAVQSDGKIVVGGQSNSNFTLVRYNTDGSLDTTFGTGGVVITSVGSVGSSVRAIAIQTDGKIVAVGSSFDGLTDDFAVARYHPNGTLDTSFDTDGKVTTAIGSSIEIGMGVVIQSNGFIIVTGYSYTGSDVDIALVRYKPEGSLDGGFGTGGIVTTSIGSMSDVANAVAIQSDGKIVVAGYSTTVSNTDFAVVRYNTNGTLDGGFGTGGIVTTSAGSSGESANDVVIQTNGFIVTAGYSFDGGNFDFTLVRYKPDGNLDPTFDGDGIVTTPIGGLDENANTAAIQSDGKIVVGGWSFNGASGNDFALARYNTNGTLDSSFGTGGKVITPFGTQGDSASAVAIQPDGKIVLAGFSHNGAENDFAVARYLGGTTIVVNTLIDESGTGANCSLYEAITAANTDTAFGGCPSGTGTDDIAFSVTGTIQLIAPLPVVTTSMNIINATGAINLIVRRNMGGNYRIFAINGSGVIVNLKGLTITNGNTGGGGGGIYNNGTMTITGCVITGNLTDSFGGGIQNVGTLTVINSTVSNNTSNISSGSSGGIDNIGILSITNSTISGNIKNNGTNNGGGIWTGIEIVGLISSTTITNSTITDNYATGANSAGGVYKGEGSTATVRNTIIAANRNNTTVPDVAVAIGSFNSSGFNLIGSAPSGIGFTNLVNNDIVGTTLAPINPLLGILSNYGGQTPTHRLQTGSPAIDKGDDGSTGASTDQRGFLRPVDNPIIPPTAGGDNSDIGAFEVQTPTAASVTISGRVLSPTGSGIFKARVTLTDFNGVVRTALTNPFGYYRFVNVLVGETYIFEIQDKRYQFLPQMITVSEEIENLNFVANDFSRKPETQ